MLENPNITVNLQTSDGEVLRSIQTKSGMNVYVSATFGADMTGSLSFTSGSGTYTVENHSMSGQKEHVRTSAIPVSGEEGAVVIITLSEGSPEDLLADGMDGLGLTDRMEGTDPRPDDSFERTVSFPIDGKTGDKAWSFTFEDLPAEHGEWDDTGTMANFGKR